MKEWKETKSMPTLVHNLSIRQRWAVNFTPLLIYPWGRTSVPIYYQKAEWASEPVRTMLRVKFKYKVRKEVEILEIIKELHQRTGLNITAVYWMDWVVSCTRFRSSVLTALCRFVLKWPGYLAAELCISFYKSPLDLSCDVHWPQLGAFRY
jgi:hypothetical protein